MSPAEGSSVLNRLLYLELHSLLLKAPSCLVRLPAPLHSVHDSLPLCIQLPLHFQEAFLYDVRLLRPWCRGEALLRGSGD